MRHRLAGLIMGLAACGAGPMTAAAQPSAGDVVILFSSDATVLRPKNAEGSGHSGMRSDAAGFNLSSPPLAPSFQPWTRPVQAAAAAPEAARKPALPAADAPVPPRAPRGAAPAPAAPASAAEHKPVMVAAVPPATAPLPKPEPLTHGEIVERANAFFTHLESLVADFTQIGGDGRRLTGTLYLQRPGKVRFEYDRPATIEVIADGSSVAVRDTKLATQDLYPLSQTPLKFLLRERVNLGQDIRITDIANSGDSVRISLEDKSTLGGTSKIMLFFDPQVEGLSQWRITDAQGFQTIVMLNKVQKGRRVDPSLFVIDYHRAHPDNPNR